MKAIGQTAFTLDYTDSANKTYYVTSTDEVATSANNTTDSGPQAYKFYVSETPNPNSGTKYDHFYNVRVNNASATVTFIFQTDKPVGFSNGSSSNQNAFRVTKGTLIMKLDKDHYKSEITLRRVGAFTATNNNSCPFYLINDAGEASHQRLIIEGLDPKPEQLLYQVSNVKQDTATYLPKRQFVIDGAANITSVNMTTGDPTYTGIATNRKPLFRIETGTLHLTNVTIQNSINSDYPTSSTYNPATHGGIYLMLNDNAGQNNRNLDVILTHCWLHNIVSMGYTGYPGIGLQWQMRKAHGSGSVVLKRSKFSSLSNLTGQEAAIRSTTGCKASVTIDSCNINNNFGGGIRWQGLVADPMQVKNTTIKGNYTKKSGGGIMAKSPLVLTACKILNNTAYEHGGGINYMCYDEPGMSVAEAGMIYPNNLELTMDATTIIDGNKTETGNGGGIMVWGRLINLTRTGQMGYVYHEYDQYGNVVGPYKLKVNLNGATIQNNTANDNGGGVYSGGGQFNIEKREGKPIVEIVDVEVVSSTHDTVHYHLLYKGNGNINYPAASPVGEHGILYGESQAAVENATVATPGSGVTKINTGHVVGDGNCYRLTNTTNLTAGTTYYVKAYAKNSNNQIGYSDINTFTTYNDKPTVVTGNVANITKNNAEVNGKLLYSNNADVCGFCYIQSNSPVDPSDLEVDDSGVDTVRFVNASYFADNYFFTKTTKTLTANKKYYVRAFAHNTNGYSYGDIEEFTTLKDTPDMVPGPLEIVSTTLNTTTNKYDVSFKYTMSTSGLTAYGFVTSTDDDPELHADNTIAGTPSTDNDYFTGTATDLDGGTTYYVRAYASNIASPGTDPTNYSITVPLQFITPDAEGKPVVRAVRIDNITQTNADITSKVVSKGTSNINTYGIVWSETVAEPTVEAGCDSIKKITNIPAEGTEFTLTTKTLLAGHTYYVRAYAINDQGTAYSNVFSFTALDITKPNVIITSVSDIEKTSADINCSVDDGGGTITNWGVKYNTTNDLASATDVNKPGTTLSGSTFTANLTSLTKHTSYYVWAYATNSAGTHTCQAVEFTTDFDKPSVVFRNPSSSNAGYNAGAVVGERDTIQAHYTVTPFNSSPPVQTHGVCFSTFHNPTRTNSDVANTHFVENDTPVSITSAEDCKQTLTLKYPNTRYFMRAYASTETPADDVPNGIYSLANIVYTSIDSSFITLPAMQTLDLVTPADVTSSGATLRGRIDSRDNEGHLVGNKYGICWSNSLTTPTIADAHLEATIAMANSSTFDYEMNVTGLSTPKHYYYRAYYKRLSDNAIAYGEVKEFTLTDYTITAVALPAAAGTVTGGGGYANSASCTLTATASTNPDYVYQGWYNTSGTQQTTNLSYDFTVSANATYQARYQSRVTITAGAHGKVSFTNLDDSGWAALEEQNTANSLYNYDHSLTVYAKASDGYTFINWTDAHGNVVSNDINYNFNVQDVTSLTANFGASKTITVNANPNEGGTAYGNGTYGEGGPCTVTATANSEYTFIYWTEGGNVVSTEANYTFTVTESTTLTANFGANQTV